MYLRTSVATIRTSAIMQNEKSGQRAIQHDNHVGLVDTPARPEVRPAPDQTDPANEVVELREKLALAERLSAQSFSLMRDQSSTIRKLKAANEALTTTVATLTSDNESLTNTVTVLKDEKEHLVAEAAKTRSELSKIIEHQNGTITRILNLPPKAFDAS